MLLPLPQHPPPAVTAEKTLEVQSQNLPQNLPTACPTACPALGTPRAEPRPSLARGAHGRGSLACFRLHAQGEPPPRGLPSPGRWALTGTQAHPGQVVCPRGSPTSPATA